MARSLILFVAGVYFVALLFAFKSKDWKTVLIMSGFVVANIGIAMR